MKKKLEELRSLSHDELMKKLDEYKKTLLSLPDTEKAKAKVIKKNIARLYTIMREKKAKNEHDGVGSGKAKVKKSKKGKPAQTKKA